MFEDWELRIAKILGVEVQNSEDDEEEYDEDDEEYEDDDDEEVLEQMMVSSVTLKKYFEYLRKKLVFPFQAIYEKETGPFEAIDIKLKITQFSEEIDVEYGLLCEGKEGKQQVVVPLADLSVKEKDRNFVLIDDYLTWFWNYR